MTRLDTMNKGIKMDILEKLYSYYHQKGKQTDGGTRNGR
jgi:hypothetical protein